MSTTARISWVMAPCSSPRADGRCSPWMARHVGGREILASRPMEVMLMGLGAGQWIAIEVVFLHAEEAAPGHQGVEGIPVAQLPTIIPRSSPR